MAETGITMEIESQNEGAFNHNEAEAPSLDNTSNPIHEKEIQDTAEHPSVNESGDFLAPLQNSSDTPRTDIGVSDSDQGATDSEAGITDSEPIVTDSEAGATDSEGGLIDSETSGTDPARHHGDQLLAPSVEEHKPEETTGDSDAQAKPTDLPIKETPAEGEDNSKKDTVNKEDSTHPAGEKAPGKENPKHRRPVIDASKLKDKSDRQKKYRNKQLELQKKSIDQQKQTKEQKRQAVEERRKKQDEEKKVYRESIVRRSIERSQSAGSREKRRSWDPAKQIPASEPPRGRSMERLNDTPNEMVPAGIGVNKRLSSSVSTLWNPVQLVRLGPNQDDWFEVHTPRPKALRSPSPGIDDPNSSTYTPRHHSSSPNLASTTSQNKSSPSTPIRRTPTPGSRGRSTERKTTAPVQPASTSETPAKTQRPASPKGFRAPSPKPSPGTPTSSSNSSMHVRQPSLRLKNKTTVDAKSPTDKTSKTPVSKSSQPPPIKKALTPAKSSPTRTPRTPSTNNKTVAASKTPAASRTPAASKTPTTTTTRTSAGSRTPTSTKTPTSKPPAANKTPTAKPAAAKSPTVPKATPITKATPTPKETPKAPSPTKEEAPKPDVPQVTEPEKKSSDSETSSPPPELSAEERAKQALAEKRRQMREKAEREAELQRLQKEQEEKEEEERLRREEEERIREEEEEQRLAEEYRKAEEERLQKAIEEQQRKEEEERLRAEEEEKKREEEERIKAEEKKKREEELNEKLKKEEEARDARKKRVDEIMKRARRGTPAVKNDDERDNRDEDKDIDTKAEKENGIEGSIYNNDNDKYRNCFGNGSTVASHETLSGEMEQDMEAVQEGVMGEDDTAYGVRESPDVVPEGGYLEGFPKENESEGENENTKSGEQLYEKAVTEEVGEKDDVVLASKIKDDSCEFEDQEEALIGETKQPVKFAEIVATPSYPVESEVLTSEKEEVGVEAVLTSDNKEALGDLLGEFESDSADGNVFSTPKLESNVEFDLLGTDVDKGLGGENDGSSVDVFVEDLNQYDSLKHPKLAFCHQESDVTEDDDSTAAQAGDIDTSAGEADPSVGDIDISASDVDLSAGDVDIRHPCDLDTAGFDTKSNFEDFTSDDRVAIHHDSHGLQDIHEEGSEEDEENSDVKNEAGENENVESDLLESCSSDRFIVIDEKSLQEGDLNSGDELVEEEEEDLPQDDDHVIPVVETSSHDKLVDDAEVGTSENEKVVEVSKDVGTIPEITLDEVEYVHQNSSGDEENEDDRKEEGQYRGGDSEDEGIVEETSNTIAHEEKVERDEEKVSEEEDVGDYDAKLESTFDITGHSHFDDSHKDEPEAINVEENDEVVEGSVRNDYGKEDEFVESPHSSLENPIEEHNTTERVEDDSEEHGSPRLDDLGVTTHPHVEDYTTPEESGIVETEGVGNIEDPSSMHRDDIDSHSSSDEGDRGNVDYLARDRVVSQSSEDKEREDSSSSSSSSDSENESSKKDRKVKVEENVFHVDAGNLGYLGDEERAQSSSPDIASRSPRVDDAEKLEFHSSASEGEDAKDTNDSFPEVSSLNATRGSPIGDITMLGVQTPEGVLEEPGRVESEDEKDDVIDGDAVPEESPELDTSEEIESGEPSSSLEASGEILLDTDSSVADVKPQFEDEQTPDEAEQLSDDESSSDSVPATMRVDDECVEREDVGCSNAEIGEDGTSSQEILLSNQHPSGEDHNGNYSSEDEDDVDSVKAAEEHDDREENGMDMGGRELTSSPSTNSTSSSEGSYTANPVDYHKNDDLIHAIDSPNTLHDQQHSVKHIGVHQDVYPGKESSIVLDAVREDDDGLNGKSAQTDEEDVSVSTEL